MTLERFLVWKTKFDKEMNTRKAREEDDRIKGLNPKEKEEWKRQGQRPTGEGSSSCLEASDL